MKKILTMIAATMFSAQAGYCADQAFESLKKMGDMEKVSIALPGSPAKVMDANTLKAVQDFSAFKTGIYELMYKTDELYTGCAVEYVAEPISREIVATYVSNPRTGVFCNSEGETKVYQCADQVNQCRAPGYTSSFLTYEYVLSILPDGNILTEKVYPKEPDRNESSKYTYMPEKYKRADRFIEQASAGNSSVSYTANCLAARNLALAEASYWCDKQFSSYTIVRNSPVGTSNDNYCVWRVELRGANPK